MGRTSRGRARFIGSAVEWARLPHVGLPEIAFAGRSNVGKSTLIGMLLGAPRLVRTSRTPGRTRTLNLFVHEETLALVDLPGYGFAKASKTELSALEGIIRDYLRARDALSGVVLVVDARRVPVSPHDLAMLRWLGETRRPVLIAVTKIDHLGKNQRRERLRSIEAGLGVFTGAAVACSGTSGEGRSELLQALHALHGDAAS